MSRLHVVDASEIKDPVLLKKMQDGLTSLIDAEIVLCRGCGEPEYWGKMRWLSARERCRSCYKALYEAENNKMYIWTDLDGPRPTREDYEAQERENNDGI